MSRNIGGDNQDLSYRYKMPRLVTKVEGRGNGIKTRLVNVADVGKAVHRDPAYITKYFGCELGAQAKINAKILEYIVNGAHDTSTFDTLLDAFIEKYVLCPKCKLPETDLSVKRGSIFATCNACGDSSQLDAKHRVDTYIIKNPPKEKDRVKVKAKKNVQKREDELAKKAATLSIKGTENEEWATDVSDAAVEARKSEVDDAVASLIQDEEEPDTVEGKFSKIIHDPVLDVPQKYKQIRSLQKAEKMGNIQRTSMLFDTLFSENILTSMAPNAEIVKTFCSDPRTHKTLLASLEALLEEKPKLLPCICDILQGFYEFEFVSEELLLSWFESNKHKYSDPKFHERVKKAAQPFFDWLQDDEEDDEEEEEEEEEDDDDEAEEGGELPAVPSTGTSTTVSSNARKYLSAANDDEDSDSSDVDLDDL